LEENKQNYKRKSLQLRQVRSSLIRLLNSLRKSMIKDMTYLVNGKRLQRLSQEEMMILTGLEISLRILWMRSMKIKKF